MEFAVFLTKRFLTPLLLAVAGGLLAAWLVPMEVRAVADQLLGFPDSDVVAHQMRPMILGVLCFVPAIGALLHALGNTLDRYVSRQFLTIFGISLGGLVMIWVLLDMANHLGESRQFQDAGRVLLGMYGIQLPAILLMLLPYALLLSFLYALGDLSRSHEIVAMIQTGRGLMRLSAPLFGASLLCTLMCVGLNYQWAPQAENNKEDLRRQANGARIVEASEVMYHNSEARRHWRIGTFPLHYERGVPLADVDVTVTHADGSLDTRMNAESASWDPATRVWTFRGVTEVRFVPGEAPWLKREPGEVRVEGWSETPWQLIKPGQPARSLGIPDLNGWLRGNAGLESGAPPDPYLTQWHNRWAQPFVCLVTMLFAVPLGVQFSRRAAGGGIILAVVLAVAMMFTGHFCLSLAEAGMIRPMLGAWIPNLLFGAAGLYLFRVRVTGRVLPRWSAGRSSAAGCRAQTTGPV